jgi:hypothetical protein
MLDSSSAQQPQDRVFKPLQDFVPQSPVSTTATLTKDPVLAVCLSIIPGAGQIYVGRYWLAPLFLGGGGFLAYQTYTYHTQFLKYSREYDALDSAGLTSRNAVNIRRLRDGYNDLRDTFGVLFLGAVLVAAVDAYTGAHLYDFDVSDDLKASLYIRPMGIGIALRGNFALLK